MCNNLHFIGCSFFPHCLWLYDARVNPGSFGRIEWWICVIFLQFLYLLSILTMVYVYAILVTDCTICMLYFLQEVFRACFESSDKYKLSCGDAFGTNFR